jgi:hypothetical protein
MRRGIKSKHLPDESLLLRASSLPGSSDPGLTATELRNRVGPVPVSFNCYEFPDLGFLPLLPDCARLLERLNKSLHNQQVALYVEPVYGPRQGAAVAGEVLLGIGS